MENNSVLELNKIEPNFLQNNNSDSRKEILECLYFYDKFSKKIIEISSNGIRIYNKNAKNLKANLKFLLPLDCIINISIDKTLNYILCLLINQQTEKENPKIKLLLLNINKATVIESIKENFTFLLGMFFIGKIISITNPVKNNFDMYDFCLVFCDKVVFYGIEMTQKIKKLSTIEVAKNILIKNYCYNYKHKILCLIKTDLTIIFINLSNRNFYTHYFTLNLNFIKNLQPKASITKMTNEYKTEIKSIFDSEIKYTETQFYLETIYDSLYFICLCYEDNCIYINELDNLITLKKKYCIEYKNHMKFSGLLFINNLILVHNFILKFFVVIDIKSKIFIINQSNCVNFPKFKNMFINGDILEERMLPLSKNSKINTYGGILYNLNFDAEEYLKIYDKANKLYKIKKKNNKNHNEMFLNKYDVLMNILNRKGNKDIILRYLYKIILNNEEKCFYIVKFLIVIIEKIYNALEKNIIPNKKINQKEIIESNNVINLPKIFDIIMEKKNYIKQIDILINIFGKLEIGRAHV